MVLKSKISVIPRGEDLLCLGAAAFRGRVATVPVDFSHRNPRQCDLGVCHFSLTESKGKKISVMGGQCGTTHQTAIELTTQFAKHYNFNKPRYYNYNLLPFTVLP
eukprot:1382780-Amorphochlora_amoeboformis.AAC.1